MKIMLDVKNMSRAIKPSKDDIMMFDGESWYITDKKSVLGEAFELLEQSKEELESLKKENEDFKKEIAKQMLEMSEIIKEILAK